MLLNERIAGLFHVIEVVPFPGLGRVTGLTFCSEMSFVIVVFQMTVITDRRGVLEKRRLVTIGAAHVPMFVQKLETRFLMIEFLDLLPTLFRMAVLASLAQFSFMLVVRTMAAGTLGRDLVGILNVAFCAGNVEMLTDERIVRFRMIETDPLPVFGRMATIALPSQLALVVIILFVAVETNLRRRFHVRRRMTFQAFDALMFSDQRKSGLVVVE